MKTPKRFHWIRGVVSMTAFCALTACNPQQTQGVDSAADAANEHFHEKSFSWDNPAGKATANGALAKVLSTATRFETTEALQQAVGEMDEALKTPGVSDSLWKPIDYACDELALGLWNKYSTITIGDSVVLDEQSLKKSCMYVGDNGALSKSNKSADDLEGAVVDIRVYPYKMIGESWDKNGSSSFGFTGALTQFKKHRSRFGITGWYDTDATRIGVRNYMLTCSYETYQRCVLGEVRSDWDRNDDYVSDRVFAAAEGLVLGVVPRRNQAGYEMVQMARHDAIIAMHSVDHAGIQFRASSSSGLGRYDLIVEDFPTSYVTW